jgi:glutaminyl-peptide cyclotransferase
MTRILTLVALLFLAASCATAAEEKSAPTFGFAVVNTYPHDPNAFTQGLIFLDGALYESTGLNGRSSLRKVKLETGESLQQIAVDSVYFAEGMTNWGKDLLQLTYKNQRGFVYDRVTFKVTRTFSYSGEGWGLTQDGKRLIMSDGSAQLRFIDPASLQETGRITVKDGTRPISDLNELEFVKGEILANVWMTDRIVRISPATGQVTGWIDLKGLLKSSELSSLDAVLNGIAYDPATDRLFVTGKLWPKLFEIKLVPKK